MFRNSIKTAGIIWQNRRARAHVVAALVTVFVLILLMMPVFAKVHAPGPMNIGHEKTKCVSCHIESPGTFRQKVQANIKFLLGQRKSSVSLVHQPVSNAQCLRCHDRPKDAHPVFRFLEPRYIKARRSIQPQNCNSCHHEHSGSRVTVAMDICSYCHLDLNLRKDALSVTHQELIELEQWRTCLGCHDYHGNHRITLINAVSEKWSEATLRNYFEGGKSPYGSVIYTAKNDD